MASQEDDVKYTTEQWRKVYRPKEELQYEYIQPKLFVEELLFPEPDEYKFFIFHGKMKAVQVDFDRFKDHFRVYCDRNWNILTRMDTYHDEPLRPSNWNQMILAAENLAPKADFVRVDFYYFNDKILGSEITFTPAAGGYDPHSQRPDKLLSSWW